MILEVSQVKLPVTPAVASAGPSKTVTDPGIVRAVARALGVKPAAIQSLRLLRRSIDARKKRDVHFVTTWAAELSDDTSTRPSKQVRVKDYQPPTPLEVSAVSQRQAAAFGRPLVVGLGPAGLFCALYLARAGLRPLVVERGADVDARTAAVEAFNDGAPLDPLTNIQFGEGGAGTFSDGKLTTGTKSPHIRHVLEEFVAAGAPEDILVNAKPHIGTDVLRGVVRALREDIVAAGGEVRFLTKLESLEWEDGRVAGAVLLDERTGERSVFPTGAVVLACGHSARDTFAELADEGIAMQRKPFAVGVRIEHPQALIDEVQYGPDADRALLGAADYKLATHNVDGRGVYTFCMCPGGEVVAAASEEGGVCVNGMSRHARDGANANSALLVEVKPEDLPGEDPLEGVVFQRALEQAAYAAGLSDGANAPYTAPAQTVGDFLGAAASPQTTDLLTRNELLNQSRARADRPSGRHAQATVQPTYPRGVAYTDLHGCLPPLVTDALEEALPVLDRKLPGFADPAAVMTAVEARSSSPVRIVRDRDTLQAKDRSGLYPCGEGAGYAGGIMSAAVDGILVAEAVVTAARNTAESDNAKAGCTATCNTVRGNAQERMD